MSEEQAVIKSPTEELFDKLRTELADSYKPGKPGEIAKGKARVTYTDLRKRVLTKEAELVEENAALRAELATYKERADLQDKLTARKEAERLAATIRHLSTVVRSSGLPYETIKAAEKAARLAEPHLWEGVFVNGSNN